MKKCVKLDDLNRCKWKRVGDNNTKTLYLSFDFTNNIYNKNMMTYTMNKQHDINLNYEL